MKRICNVWCLFVLLAAAAPASAQTVEVDPLQCWWRTSAGAVRVGEPFSVVLTCAVVETDAVTVVPDQGPLEPTAIQLPPFEVLSGTHHADLRADGRRFLQYDYRLRIINEDVFGKDVAIPELKVTYRVRTQVNGAAIEGMEKTYNLPVLSMRILSLVPAGATDIRDATASTFGDIEDRLFRANALTTLGGVLFGLSAIFALVALVRAIARYRRARPAAAGVVSDADILRGMRIELARIGRARQGGWTPELSGRLLTALRVIAAFALSKPAGHLAAVAGRETQDGYLDVRGGWTRGKRVSVFGYITPLDVSRETISKANDPSMSAERLALLEDLRGALARLTAGQYGQEPWQDAGLDEALDVGSRVMKRVRIDRLWPVRTFRAASRATVDFRQRVWSR
jgi:hypothetical protein